MGIFNYRYVDSDLDLCRPDIDRSANFLLRGVEEGCKNVWNIEILWVEFAQRSISLVQRIVKVFFEFNLLLLSPLGFPGIAWDRFCKEVRYLAAELFEDIGVLVFSILHLPFKRDSSSLLLKYQIALERGVEYLSGEAKDFDLNQKHIQNAQRKKELLLRIRNTLEISEDERKRWLDKVIDFDEISWDNDLSRHRRICRQFYPVSKTLGEQLAAKTSEIAEIISDRIASEAIVKQKNRLLSLVRIGNFDKPAVCEKTCNKEDSLEVQLELFQELEGEINRCLQFLHDKHDPKNVLGAKIESLRKQITKDFAAAVKGHMSTFNQGVEKGVEQTKEMFDPVLAKIREIEGLFNFSEITNEKDLSSRGKFTQHLEYLIAECNRLLKEVHLEPNDKFSNGTDWGCCLRILDITDSPKLKLPAIQKAYHRLARIHHPDDGGNAEVFIAIRKAYEYASGLFIPLKA